MAQKPPRMPQDERKANQTRGTLATEPTRARKAKARPHATPEEKAHLAPKYRPVLTSEQRARIQAAITENPTAIDSELAEMTGVSSTSVRRIRERMDVTDEESTAEYGRRLGKKLPMALRVRLWSKLARGEADPRYAFIQKAALQRVEELIGHVTAKEKRETELNQQLPGPIIQISLPPGAAAVMVAPVRPQGVVVGAETKELPTSVKPVSE